LKETPIYFDKPGKDNTDQTLKLAADRGQELGIEEAVVALTTIISIGGSGNGADAASVLKPAHQNNFFDLRIREIICKPRLF